MKRTRCPLAAARRRAGSAVITGSIVALSLVGLSATSTALAQAWPSKPIRMFVGFPPGQATDIVARAVGNELSKTLGQQIIIDNRPGAAGIIASEITAKATPDGYSIQMSSSGPLAVNPGLYPKLPYDVARDFAPVTLAAIVPLYLVANPAFPAKTLKELVAHARANPGKINFASGGSGVTNHLVMESFRSIAGLQMTHVPYKGGPPAIADLIAGNVPIMFETGPGVLPHVRAGKLNALAIGSLKRSAASPDVPTVAEQGFPGFEGVAWIGMVAPRAVPKDILARLHAETVKAIMAPAARDVITSLGAEPTTMSQEEFGAYIRSETERWAKVVRESGAKVD
jgi:tripartite-type tricarboxylate transporter receptor subunit TctC